MLRGVLIVALLGCVGCKPDKCRSAEPAFQLDIVLPGSVDGSQVASLAVTIAAAGLQRQQSLDVAGKLSGDTTSVSVTVGPAGAGGFLANVDVEALDRQGRTLAGARAQLPGTGDACNFFRLALASADAGTDGPRLDARVDAKLVPDAKLGPDTKLAPDTKLGPDTKLAPDTKLPLDTKIGPEVKVPVPDTKPPLLVNWRQDTACASQYSVLGGGGNCGAGGKSIAALAPSPFLDTFTVSCLGGQAHSWVACKGTFNGQLQTSTGGNSATCPGTHPRVAGGGCDCSSGQVESSYPVYNAAGTDNWNCVCHSGSPSTTIVCTDANTSVTVCSSQASCSVCSSGGTIIGGGCRCNSAALTDSDPTVTAGVATQWHCDCGGGPITSSYIICAP